MGQVISMQGAQSRMVEVDPVVRSAMDLMQDVPVEWPEERKHRIQRAAMQAVHSLVDHMVMGHKLAVQSMVIDMKRQLRDRMMKEAVGQDDLAGQSTLEAVRVRTMSHQGSHEALKMVDQDMPGSRTVAGVPQDVLEGKMDTVVGLEDDLASPDEIAEEQHMLARHTMEVEGQDTQGYAMNAWC